MAVRSGRMVALLAVVAGGIAGCTSSTDAAPAPTAAPASAGVRTPEMPPGKTCAEVATAIGEATRLGLRPADGGAQEAGAESRPGARECVLATGETPRTEVRVTLYRLRFGTDTPEGLLRQVRRQAGECETELASPPVGVGYATSCAEETSGAVTATTTLLTEAGWTSAVVTAQGGGDGAAAKTAEQAAIEALSLI